MKRALITLLLLATPHALAAPALAQTGSNIGLTQYPAPKCSKPPAVDESLKPRAPERPNDDQAIAYNKKVDAYNAQMRAHNAQVTAYGECIQAYLANGSADARRIREALDAAVAAANAK